MLGCLVLVEKGVRYWMDRGSVLSYSFCGVVFIGILLIYQDAKTELK